MIDAARSLLEILNRHLSPIAVLTSDLFRRDLHVYIREREARLIERCCDEVQNAMGQAGSWQHSGWGVMEQIRAIKPETI